MINIIARVLIVLNDHYSSLILGIVATISAIVAYKEYILRRRPYVMPEIIVEVIEDKWFFHIMLVNKGEYPAIVKIAQALLTIGDEKYPTEFNLETILSPGEKQKVIPIGHINENGRKKIRGHEYRSNRVEILIDLDSKALGQKQFKYETKVEYEVDVSGEKPIFKLIKEEML